MTQKYLIGSLYNAHNGNKYRYSGKYAMSDIGKTVCHPGLFHQRLGVFFAFCRIFCDYEYSYKIWEILNIIFKCKKLDPNYLKS